MSSATPSGDAELAMRDLWDRTLAQVSTVFGQMTYLASLRDGHSGRYSHYGLAQVYGEEAAHHALNASHERTFAEWVNYSLDKQRSDLEAYLDGIEEPRADVLKSWAAIMPYKSLVPAGSGGCGALSLCVGPGDHPRAVAERTRRVFLMVSVSRTSSCIATPTTWPTTVTSCLLSTLAARPDAG